MERKLLLLTDMVNNSPFPMAVYMGEDLIIESANPAMTASWGATGDVLGRKFFEVVGENQKQLLYNQVMNAYHNGIPFHAKDKRVEVELEGLTRIYYFNYSFIPMFDKYGTVYGMMSTTLDVTELHQANHQLKLSNERLRMAIDSSGMGTYEIDLSTKKIKTSPNFNTIWSVTQQEQEQLTNEMLISRMHPDDLIIRDRAFAEGESTGVVNYEIRIKKGADYRWVKVNAKIISDELNRPHTVMGISQDIHHQMEFAAELQRKVEESTADLKRSNEDLLHFAHVASHDLKEPVRKVKYFNSLLSDQANCILSEKQQRYVAKIDHSARRMQNIIDGILAYSTINSSHQEIADISLNNIMEEIRTDLELVIEEKQAEIHIGQLPHIEGASILIHQLFYNLIQNSLKFSKPDHTPRIKVTAESLGDEHCVLIKVSDNGIGIDPSYAEKIFNAFERLHSKDSYEGNGLGLSLCRKIATRHGGSINADGEPGRGTDFTVRLPLKQSGGFI